MNFFFWIWIALSIFLIVFWFWSIVILYLQKQAWKAFAKRKNLRYRSRGVFESPEITGVLKDYNLFIFTTEHETDDGRMPRRLTSIEVSLKSCLPLSMAIASGGMVRLVEELNFKSEFRPDVHGWDNSYIARSNASIVPELYLTDVRLKSILNLMKIKNSWVILFFTPQQGLLRLDTPHPLHNIKSLEEILKKLVGAAEIFEVSTPEFKKVDYKAKQAKPKSTQSPVSSSQAIAEAFDEPMGLSLEDD